MSNQLLSSKIVVIEETPKVRSIRGALTSVTGAVGITERGPFGPNLCTSFDEYLKLYGADTVNSDVCPAARGYFAEQGGTGFFWVCRTVHYSDPTNPASKTSAAATGTALTSNLAATAGKVTSSLSSPFVLTPGDTLATLIDGSHSATTTFSATAASRTGTTGTYALVNNQTLTLTINGGATQTVTFLTSQFVSIGAATALEVAAVINASITGASATVVTNAVKISTDQLGTGAAINVTGGAANGALAFTTGSTSGGGNVANIAAVTATEAAALISTAVSTFGSASNVSGAVQIVSTTTGASSSVQVTSGGTAQSKFGFDTATHTGNNAGTLSTLTVDGKTDGTYANNVTMVISTATNGKADFFNLVTTQNGSNVETFPNVTMAATDTRYVVTTINDAVQGSNLITLTDLFASTPSPNNRPANGTYTLSGGNDGLTSLADSDYVGSVVVNQAYGTGLRALDTVSDLSILVVPGKATPVIHNAMVTYCEATRFGSVFPILATPASQSAQQMNTYVVSTAGLVELSEFGAIYWPRVKVANPNPTVYGTATTITVDPSGLIAGVYARNDNAKPGGVYEAPAGVEFGKLSTVLGLESDEVKDEIKRDLIQPNHINPIVGITGQPIHIDGADTLKSTGNFPTIGERRGVIFIEQSLKSGLIFAKHRKIKPSLLSQLNRTVTNFLNVQMRNDAFATNDAKTAYSVDFSPGLNPPSEALAQRVNGRIGLATAKPATWIILRVGQDTTALEAELAAA